MFAHVADSLGVASLLAEQTYAESRVRRAIVQMDWNLMPLVWHHIAVQRRRCGYYTVQLAEMEVEEECSGSGREKAQMPTTTFHAQELSQSLGSQGREMEARVVPPRVGSG